MHILQLTNSLYDKILYIFSGFKRDYLTIILINLASGFSRVHLIAMTFWYHNNVDFTPQQIVAVSAWATFPWTAKILIGQLQDSISIFGSIRKNYINLGNIFLILGGVILIAVGNEYATALKFFSMYDLVIISTILLSTGTVLQDMVADTMVAEVVKYKGNNKASDTKQELTYLQLIVRLTMITSFLLSASIGGFLASHFTFAKVCFAIFIVPVLGSVAAHYYKFNEPKKIPIDKKSFIIAILYFIALLFLVVFEFENKQEIGFFINLSIICFFVKKFAQFFNKNDYRNFVFSMFIIFIYRTVPSFGPGIDWWKIDVLGFSPNFFAILQQTNFIIGIIGVVFLTKWLINNHIAKVLIYLIILETILELPTVAMSFGFHEWTMEHFGIGPKSLAIIDLKNGSNYASAVKQISMIPITYIFVHFAPKKNKSTWFGMTASCMNLALMGSALLTKYLAKIFSVTRGDYTNISSLMVTTSAIGLIMPIVALLLCYKLITNK